MMIKAKKHQKMQKFGETESFVDSMFIALSQSYLINSIMTYWKENDGDNKHNKLSVMELGCYNGRLMQFLIQFMTVPEYTGVDINKKYFENTKMWRRKDTTFIEADITQGLEQVKDNSQDMIVSSEVLEHIEAKHLTSVLKTLYDKLKPGGRLVVSFPMNTRKKKFHKLEKEKSLGHVNFPVHENFKMCCKKIGYKLVKFDSGYSLKSSYPCQHKTMIKSPIYQKFRHTLGSRMARALWMVLTDDHTGGGYYTFDK